MAAKILIRPTEPGDIQLLADNMRECDRRESAAYGHGQDLTAAIARSVRSSVLCWSGFADGGLGCIMGCAPISYVSGIGSPWMMGTPVLDKHSRILVKRTPEYTAKMLKAFPHLVNFVHVTNKTSILWLKRLGFTIHPPVPYGALGELFHPFEMRAENV